VCKLKTQEICILGLRDNIKNKNAKVVTCTTNNGEMNHNFWNPEHFVYNWNFVFSFHIVVKGYLFQVFLACILLIVDSREMTENKGGERDVE